MPTPQGYFHPGRLAVVIVVAVILGIAVIASLTDGGGDGGGGEPGTAPGDGQSIEYKLAVVNAGRDISEDDITVARFRTLLDRLEVKCLNGRQHLADMAVAARDLLREQGIDRKPLAIMEFVDQETSMPSVGSTTGVRCAPIFAQYVVQES